MHDVLRATTEQFADAGSGMRDAARQVVTEVERARGDIMGAFGSMPREVGSSIEEMRRVIVEQLEALESLRRLARENSMTARSSESSSSSSRL